MKNIIKTLIVLLLLLVSATTAQLALAANFNIDKSLCTITRTSGCSPHRTADINIPTAGNYTLAVTVERGNNTTMYECQDQESFYITLNNKNTPVIRDPDACEYSGTVKTQTVSGTYYLPAGNNTIHFYHAESASAGIESLTIKSLTLNRLAAVPTCSLSANPTTINAGNQSTLTWSSTEATSLSINQGVGGVATAGSTTVSPTQTTTYTATASNADGNATCNATIIVNNPESAITINKNDADNNDDQQTVASGSSANFRITVTNTGEASLRDVTISDPNASDCNRSASQTNNFYDGDTFDPNESFTYTCSHSNITASYINTAQVTAVNINTSRSLSASDTSSITLANTPPPVTPITPEPEEEEEKECKGKIGNYIWLDSDGDGVQDDNEKGLGNIRVKLTFGNTTYRTTTDNKGYYSFKHLCKGNYTVTIKKEDLVGYTQTYDPDKKKNNKTDVRLENYHDDHTKADFGYKGKHIAPATGSGSIALYLSLLATIIAFVTYKKIQAKKLAIR